MTLIRPICVKPNTEANWGKVIAASSPQGRPLIASHNFAVIASRAADRPGGGMGDTLRGSRLMATVLGPTFFMASCKLTATILPWTELGKAHGSQTRGSGGTMEQPR